jgi:uncharacterized protein
MVDIIVMKTTGKGAPRAEAGTPDPAKLIKGSYRTKSWNHFTGEDGRLYSGIWECTPGKVTCSYDEWEFCHIISGSAVLASGRKKWRVKKGDAFIIPPGFTGTWETVRKLRKHYVILAPKGAA